MCLFPMVYSKSQKKVLGHFDRAQFDDDFYALDQFRNTGSFSDWLLVPCSKCVECRRQHAREWGMRCADELSQSGGVGSFVTLTYKDAPDGLIKKDLQDFFKRLRKHIYPDKVRYFAAGEYGDLHGRPHFHAALFGWKPRDLDQFFFREDHWVYKSEELKRIWNKGYVSVEDLTYDNCVYIVPYMQKVVGLGDHLPPFNVMSTRPAIGCRRLSLSDCISDDKIYSSAGYCKLPRAYLRRYESLGKDLSDLKARREDRARICETGKDEILAARDDFFRRSRS